MFKQKFLYHIRVSTLKETQIERLNFFIVFVICLIALIFGDKKQSLEVSIVTFTDTSVDSSTTF